MPKTNRAWTVVALILSLSMGALEATVVTTAMPTIVAQLGGIQHYAWVTTAYLLTSTVSVPIFGKLADTYGRKPILLFGIAVFLLGSIASGSATSMTQLIAFRAFQGLGAGSMQPMALTIVGDIFDVKERGKMQGVFGAVWGVSGLIGPLVGGLLVRHASWPWVFRINVPFGVLSALLVLTNLFETIEKKPHKLDFAGAAALILGVTALLAAASGTVPALPAGLLAAALLGLFLLIESRAAEPVLPLGLFKQPVLSVSSLAGAITGGAMFTIINFVPLLVQGVLHGSATEAGTAFAPMLVGWPIASAVAGRMLPITGFRPLIRLGLAIAAVSAVALRLLEQRYGLWALRGSTALFGVGMGFANTALLISVQTSVAWEQRGIATASTMFFRTIGGTIAVGVTGGVLARALASDPTVPPDAASQILRDRGQSLDPGVLAHVSEALAHGLDTIFTIVAAMATVAFIVSLWFPRTPTHAPA
jgi:EmrB/QacA subfamily drug resistance transporter